MLAISLLIAIGIAGCARASTPHAQSAEAKPKSASFSPKWCSGQALIDDFEDGDSWLGSQRTCGIWGMSTDEGASLKATSTKGEPIETALWLGVAPTAIRDNSAEGSYALHLEGEGQTEWGAYLFAQLRSAGKGLADREPVDISHHDGIEFLAKGSVPGGMRVFLATRDTALRRHGGTCAAECSDHYGWNVPITKEWQRFRVPFSKLRQRVRGRNRFDLRQVLSVEFQVPPNGRPFELWLDDVRFYSNASLGPEEPQHSWTQSQPKQNALRGVLCLLPKDTKRIADVKRCTPAGVLSAKKLSVAPRSGDVDFPGIGELNGCFAIDYHGNFEADVAGPHTFRLLADDAALLWIDGTNRTAGQLTH